MQRSDSSDSSVKRSRFFRLAGRTAGRGGGLILLCSLIASGAFMQCSEESLPELPDPTTQLAVWAEYMSYEQVEGMGDFLAENNLTLNLAFTKDVHDWDEFADCVRAMRRLGVPVIIWPELTNDEGKWPNARNWRIFNPFFRDIMDRIEEDDLPIEWLVIDMETSWDKAMVIQDYFLNDDMLGLADMLVTEFDLDLFEEAVGEFQGLIEEAHTRGFKVRLSAVGMILEDLLDGDRAFQIAFDIPIENLDWDEASFQLYRSLYNSLYAEEGEEYTSYLVYSYGLTVKEYFGQEGSVDLGIIASSSFDFEGFGDPGDMLDDIAAARAAGFGIGQIDIFALDGIYDSDASEQAMWVDFESTTPTVPDEHDKVLELRETLQAFDLMFDEDPDT